MTTKEKLDIINSWTTGFHIKPGKMFTYTGILFTNPRGTAAIHTIGNDRDDLIDETYEQFRDYMWKVVCTMTRAKS
jgi:hypothetical protein